MLQEENIATLRQEMRNIHEQASNYFDKIAAVFSQIIAEKSGSLLFSISDKENDYYWSCISEEYQKVADTISVRLIQVMNKIVAAVKVSPLLGDADQRDLSTNTKKMRAALHLRRYQHWDTEFLHDEGTVLGVRPAGQMEDTPMNIEDSRRAFENSYANIERIIDLITPGESEFASIVVSSQSQAVGKYRQNTAFIMMWMDKENRELDDVKDVIKGVFDSFGIRAIRADDIEHEDVITKRILEAITTSEFLIADLTGVRPSVYYEVGYAHALGKRVILFRKKGTPLHFDLAGYHCPEYENMGDLRKRLEKRLQAITNKTPNQSNIALT